MSPGGGEQRPLRVVIDARMTDGSGGVQQWVIGLAGGLSQLEDATEEYRFLVDEGGGDWLVPYLRGPCSLLVQPAVAPAPVAAPVEARASRGGGGGGRGPLGALARRFRIVRRLRRRLFGRRSRSPEWRSALDRTVREAGAHLMHFTRPSASATVLPTIYQPWDLQHVHLPEFFAEDVRAARDAVYRMFCEQAARIVVATRWVKDDLAAQYGIAPDRIAVVNPATPTDVYAPPTADEELAIASRLGLPERFAFYPAQTWGHKNHERLFEALRQLRDRGVEVPLVCSGHRNARFPELERRLAGLGLDGQVRFLGFLTPAEIQVVYRRAALLVFPSLYEGWGLPIIEAFAAGLPVACSNVTSLPALVGDAARVFEPTDVAAIASAIEALWLDGELRRALVERGRARSRQFDWRRTAVLMRAHYREIAGRALTDDDRAMLAAEPLV